MLNQKMYIFGIKQPEHKANQQQQKKKRKHQR